MAIYLSPNNCVFEIEKKTASAWFISEFDPTDDAYNPPTGSDRRKDWKIDKNYVEFPGVTGKRTIAIHWTFVEDNDKSSKFNTEAGKAKAKGEYKLHYQFSGNLAERSMDGVNQYLKEKKEEKEKANELKNAELPLLRLTDMRRPTKRRS